MGPTSKQPIDPDALAFGLLENGLDFLLAGTQALRDDADPRELKYAILHLAAGVELIHKEALHREDWKLLFDRVEQADAAALATGSFKSVGPVTAIQRLEDEAAIVLSPEETALLAGLRDRRNRIQHFEFHDTKTAVTAVAARVVGVALDFIADHLDDGSLTTGAADDLEKLREQLPNLTAFVAERRAAISDQLAAERLPIVTCVSCWEDAAIVDDGTRCLFCRVDHRDPQEVAEVYAADVLGEIKYQVVKDGGEWVVSQCPSCGLQTLLDLETEPTDVPSRRWICFACSTQWNDDELDRCTSCGAWYPYEEGGLLVCDSCFEYAISKD